VLEGLIDRFVYLHYGLGAILVFVGAKFVAQGFGVHVPILASLLVIATITVAIVASLIATRRKKPGGGSEDTGSGWGSRVAAGRRGGRARPPLRRVIGGSRSRGTLQEERRAPQGSQELGGPSFPDLLCQGVLERGMPSRSPRSPRATR
jgi:hypothetical protein